jgi:hypothetical protein
MEKFHIAQYGFIQMVALAYGILGSSFIAKGMKYVTSQGRPVPAKYEIVVLYHDYGIFLSLIIIAWAVFCAYHSTIFSKWNFGENVIVISGLALTALFFLSGTILIFLTFAAAFETSV